MEHINQPNEQEPVETSPEWQLPASLAIKCTLERATTDKLRYGKNDTSQIRMRNFETPEGNRGTIVRNPQHHLTEILVETSWNVAAPNGEITPADETLQRLRYELRGQDEDLQLMRTGWPRKSDEEESTEVSEAEARQLLGLVAQLGPIQRG